MTLSRVLAFMFLAIFVSFAGILQPHTAIAQGVDTEVLSNGMPAIQDFAISTEATMLTKRNNQDPLARHIEFWLTRPMSGRRLADYDLDMTTYAQALIVTDDLQTFTHTQPVFHSDGRFLLDQHFPHAGLYHVFIDTSPVGIGRQAFRFDVFVDAPKTGKQIAQRRPQASDAKRFADGDYAIDLNRTKIAPNGATAVDATIYKDGRLATSLQPYLGNNAFISYINTRDLSYDQARLVPLKHAPGVGPHVRFILPVKRSGAYRVWFQFRDQQKIHNIAFVITAK